MITLLFLKAFSDLGFVYAIFSPVISVLSLHRGVFFLGWILQSLAYSLSFQLKDKGFLKYLPFLLCLAPLPLDPRIATAAFLLIGMGYGIWYASKNAFFMDRDLQINIFSIYWKLAIAEVVILFMLGKAEILSEWTLALDVLVITTQIMMMRSLRHDQAVYTTLRYQVTEVGVMALLGIAVAFISSPQVRGSVLMTIKFWYMQLVLPVLLVVLRGVAFVLGWFVEPLKRLMEKNRPEEAQKIEINMESMKDLLEIDDTDMNPDAAKRVEMILIGIGILIAVAVIIMLFRYFSPERHPDRRKNSGTVSRSFIKTGSGRGAQEDETDASSQVRARYRSFLKIYRKMRLPLAPATTSGDIMNAAETHFDPDANSRMRQLYIAARYDDSSTESDAAEAKELLKKLRETAGKKDE